MGSGKTQLGGFIVGLCYLSVHWLVHSTLRGKKLSCKAQFHIPWIHELWATLANSTLPHLIEASISLGPLRRRQFNGIEHIRDLLREILLKDKKEWEQDYMGRDFQLQCRSGPCERGERRKENLVERPSDCRAALRKSWPDGWAVSECRCPLEKSRVGQGCSGSCIPTVFSHSLGLAWTRYSLWKNAEVYPKGVLAGGFQQITLLISSLSKGNLSGMLMVATITLSRKWILENLIY